MSQVIEIGSPAHNAHIEGVKAASKTVKESNPKQSEVKKPEDKKEEKKEK